MLPAMDLDIEICRAAEHVLWHTRISLPGGPGVPFADIYLGVWTIISAGPNACDNEPRACHPRPVRPALGRGSRDPGQVRRVTTAASYRFTSS